LNIPFLDYDLNNQKDRITLVESYLDNCQQIEIVEETFLHTGYWQTSEAWPEKKREASTS
jgi:hypothetical protein